MVDMVPVIDNTAQTAGTYLIGDFQRAVSLYQRRAITLKFHDSDDVGDVTKDMSTVTISERIAMPIFRTSALVTDTWAHRISRSIRSAHRHRSSPQIPLMTPEQIM